MTVSETLNALKSVQHQNTANWRQRNEIEALFIEKGIKKLFYTVDGVSVIEHAICLNGHEQNIINALVRNSLTHEVSPIRFRDGYAFMAHPVVIAHVKTNT